MFLFHLLCFFRADLDAGDGHGEGEPENDQHAGIVPQEIRQTADHRAAHGRRSGGCYRPPHGGAVMPDRRAAFLMFHSMEPTKPVTPSRPI